jgi:single-strand DNA-binding protein
MNSITVAGQLGRDAEMKYLTNGDAVLNFSVADSAGRDKPTIWWSCQLFGKRAESLSQYLKKGQAVTVSGSVTEREWTDKDGNTKKAMNVRVNEVALQGGRREEEAKPKTNPYHKPASDGMDDDLPF